VVFARQDQPLHARALRGPDDLLGVESGRIEHLFLLVAVPPFLVGERVHRKVEEAIELHFVPAELAFRGHRPVGQRRGDGDGGQVFQRNGEARSKSRQDPAGDRAFHVRNNVRSYAADCAGGSTGSLVSGMGHGLRADEPVKLLAGEGTQFTAGLAQADVVFVGRVGDAGGLVVTEPGAERRDEHERVVD